MLTSMKLKVMFGNEIRENRHDIRALMATVEALEEYASVVREERFDEMTREQLAHHMVRHNHFYVRNNIVGPYKLMRRLYRDQDRTPFAKQKIHPVSMVPKFTCELRRMVMGKLSPTDRNYAEFLFGKTLREEVKPQEGYSPSMTEKEAEEIEQNIIEAEERTMVPDSSLEAMANELFATLRATCDNWAQHPCGTWPFGSGEVFTYLRRGGQFVTGVLAVPEELDVKIKEFIKQMQVHENGKGVMRNAGFHVDVERNGNVWVCDGLLRVLIL